MTGLAAITLWWRFVPRRGSPHQAIVAHNASNSVAKATLDFRNATVERSGGTQAPNLAEIPHLNRSLVNIAIKLPMGTDDGVYAIELRTSLNQSVVRGTGTATWDGSAETLTTVLDLRPVKSGHYKLAIRHDGLSWHEYPVVIE